MASSGWLGASRVDRSSKDNLGNRNGCRARRVGQRQPQQCGEVEEVHLRVSVGSRGRQERWPVPPLLSSSVQGGASTSSGSWSVHRCS